jgi:Tol biopolymer transport system component/DNA-binding winged helix-turn-helix (wHTH) protein
MATRDEGARLAFGPFELNPSAGELRKRGVRVPLSGQPVEILLVLLDHAGDLVTRDQLRERVWSDGTIVDFEGGLNAAMAKLRRALDDSAQNPRYIETVPGRGYRFLLHVEAWDPEIQSDNGNPLPPADGVVQAAVETTSASHPRAWRWLGISIFCAALLALIVWRFTDRQAPSPQAWHLSALTTSAALESWPALSPDGKLVVYSADPDFNGKVDLYLKDVAGDGAPIRLTSDGEGNRMADFSPDGKRVVFRSNHNGGGIYQMPTLGGDVQLVVKEGLNPKFSPDGQQIAYWTGSESVGAAVPGSGSVWVVPVRGGPPVHIAESLTSAKRPIWLPGGTILFVGYSATTMFDGSRLDWWIASVNGERPVKTGLYDELVRRGIKPSDPAANSRFTTPVPWIAPPGCWAARQGAVVASLEGINSGNLWAIRLSPNTGRIEEAPTRLTTGTANELEASCSPVGALAFTDLKIKQQLWMQPFDLNQAKSKGPLQQITEDSNERENPTLSADGRYMAFASNKSGRPNIWRRDLDTEAETQVAPSALVEQFPVMSPSGRRIAYSVYDSDQRDLYLVDSGRSPEKLCDGCRRPTDWSHDENSLLIFTEEPHGGSRYQIKLFHLPSRQQTTLLSHERYSLLYGRFSPDGRWISFTIRIRPDLAKVAIAPFHGAASIPEQAWITIADVGIDDYANWSPDGKTLYFSSAKDGNNCLWAQSIDAATGRPIGEAFAIQHFHGRVTFSHAGWVVGGGRIGMTLVDRRSNIWTMFQ